MLTLTNGDAIISDLRAAGIDDDIVPWIDVLHEGPVPGKLSDDAFALARARFIASAGWANEQDAFARFAARDKRLDRAFEKGEQILLVFEDDLYDQLQLMQILHRIARQGRSTLCRVAQGDRPLYQYSTDQLCSLINNADQLSADTISEVSSLWEQFCSSSEAVFRGLSGKQSNALPYLGPAFLRLIEELPSSVDGLSRTDRSILLGLGNGPLPFDKLFMEIQLREERPFMSDLVLAIALLRLSGSDPSLVVFASSKAQQDSHALIAENVQVSRSEAGDRVVRYSHPVRMPERWLGGLFFPVALYPLGPIAVG